MGALLLVVTLKTSLSAKRSKELGDPKPWQEFLGHYGVFACIALMQSTFSPPQRQERVERRQRRAEVLHREQPLRLQLHGCRKRGGERMISGISGDFDSTIKPDLAQMNSSFTSAAQQINTSVGTAKDARRVRQCLRDGVEPVDERLDLPAHHAVLWQ